MQKNLKSFALVAFVSCSFLSMRATNHVMPSVQVDATSMPITRHIHSSELEEYNVVHPAPLNNVIPSKSYIDYGSFLQQSVDDSNSIEIDFVGDSLGFHVEPESFYSVVVENDGAYLVSVSIAIDNTTVFPVNLAIAILDSNLDVLRYEGTMQYVASSGFPVSYQNIISVKKGEAIAITYFDPNVMNNVLNITPNLYFDTSARVVITQVN